MRYILCGLLLLVMALSYGQTIHLQEAVKVKGLSLLLNDLAEIPEDPGLGQVCLGKTPALGQTVVYDRETITARLQELGVDVSQIIWEGEMAVSVETESMAVSPDQLAAVAKDFLETSLPWPVEDMSCELTGATAAPLLFPAPRHAASITPRLASNLLNRGRAVVEIIATVDGQQVQRCTLVFQIRVFSTVFITTRFIPRHTVLQQQDLQSKRLEITNFSETPLASWDAIVGKQMRSSQPAHHILSDRDLEPETVIRRGSMVSVVWEYGNLKISITARSLENGGMGDVIRLLNLSSNKIIQGKVIAGSTVVIPTGER